MFQLSGNRHKWPEGRTWGQKFLPDWARQRDRGRESMNQSWSDLAQTLAMSLASALTPPWRWGHLPGDPGLVTAPGPALLPTLSTGRQQSSQVLVLLVRRALGVDADYYAALAELDTRGRLNAGWLTLRGSSVWNEERSLYRNIG